MKKYRKKIEEVEVYTYDEVVEYGNQHTHILISPEYVLIVDKYGNLTVRSIQYLNEHFESISEV